jgi:hypothetical protein
MEALALLGVSAALTLTKSAKIDNFAKGMMLFSAAKIIYPNPIKKATVEDYTGRL